jgi:hypothetical protein
MEQYHILKNVSFLQIYYITTLAVGALLLETDSAGCLFSTIFYCSKYCMFLMQFAPYIVFFQYNLICIQFLPIKFEHITTSQAHNVFYYVQTFMTSFFVSQPFFLHTIGQFQFPFSVPLPMISDWYTLKSFFS